MGSLAPSPNVGEIVGVKRWIVILVVVAAVAPFLIAFLVFLDEGTKIGKLSETRGGETPSDVSAAPAPAAAATVPAPSVPAAAPEPAARTEPEPVVAPAEEPPSAPPPAGVLECIVAETAAAKEARTQGGGRCTLRVLLPTGVELATHDVAVPGKWRFEGLPTGVPLVVAVGGKGYLAGLCCDVRLAPDAPSAKRIDLLPAPTVRVSVTVGGKRSASSGLRVELRSGDVTVADAVAGGDDAVTMRPHTFGVLRARVSRGADVLVDGVAVPVDATSAVQDRTVDVRARGTVEASGPARGTGTADSGATPAPRPAGIVLVRVLDEKGEPVEDAEVFADTSRRRAKTGDSGTCRFEGLDAGTELTFFSRCRGFRSRAGALPSVRVPREGAAEVEIVLREETSGSDKNAPVTATGAVLDAAGEAVVAARVTASGKVAFTDAEGRFRLTGLAAGASDPTEVLITPMPSLLEPLRVLVDPDEKGLADAGTVKLRARPYAIFEVPPRDRAWTKARDTAWRSESVRCFFFSANHADALLGEAHGAFEPFACVSYDGTWMHLPPAGDWASDARGEVFAAYATPGGLFTTTSAWTLAPDAAPRVAMPPPAGPGPIGADAKKLAGDTDCYRQFHCATLYEPRDANSPSGDAPPPVDPFAPLVAWRTFVWSPRDLAEFGWQTAPGRWRVTDGGGADRTFDVRPAAAATPPK